MASKPDETTQLECPVCHEDYANPKILPCSHLTCYRCVVSWLRKTVGQGGCPVCRAPIAPPTSLGQGDFVTLVDALPTDLLMVDMVQNKELLGNSNVCCICENDIEATSYCFDCCIKLCKTCAKGHGKYPAFRDHVLEDLKKITVQSLVASRHPKCYSHSDRPAELYCCAHNKLICCECATDSHGACGDKKKIPESATLKRAELRERAQRLKDKERALSEQVSQIKEQYSAIRAKVKDTFDDLQHAVERRHQEINTKLQEDELATMASLTELNKYRSALTSNAGSIQHLVTTAPDAFLLGMLEKLALSLDHLEFQSRATGKVKAAVDVNFKPQALALVKTAISRLGYDDARQMHPATEAAVPKPQAPSPVASRDEEKAAAPDDAEQMVDKMHLKQMIDGQWSPVTPEGKKQYDHEFLLKPQASPESRKPRLLSDMPEMADSGNPGSVNKRGSQKGQRGGQGSQGGEQKHQEITLHKSENAYKPMLFQKDVDADDEARETQQVLRAFKSILNKLTPEKYKKLAEDVLQLNINTEERLSGVTDLVFEKAIAESKFATQYAFLCRDMLKLPKVPKKDKPNETLTFRAVLLTKCQKEFESDTIVEGDLDRRRKELDKASDDQKTMLVEELKEATTKARRRSMGNIRFIGELYRLKMLTENIMHDCIFKLLKIRDDDSIECLTKLLETIGKDLDHPKAKQRMDQYFAQFEKMTADMSKDPQIRAQSKGKESKDKLCTRVKFSVLEIIDMRKNNWVIRKIHDQNKPSTLGEIHQKAKMEQQEQQFLNSQPRMDSNPQSRGAKGKGRGSMQGDTDGWNTVPAKPVRQQIDAAKMKLTKTNVDEITLTLGGGNKFSSWGRGSQGGGSRSQEQEKSGNRYNALNSLNDSDGRRGYGRSPARGDSRGGGRMGGDRDRRDRDRDFRSKPASRSSMEAERERAVASTRNMLGAGAASNPSSRNSSRDNSRSRDMPPSSAPRVPSGPDASQMNAQELERRLTTIAEELHSNQNIKDARESISEISHLDHSVLVMTMLEKLVEKAGKTRKLLGQMLYDMIKERQMSIDDLIKGIAEFLQYAEDLELDIPKIWDNLAEVFASLLQDSKVLPLHFLQACMQPLVSQGNKKEAVLVQKILKTAAEYKSKDVIQAYWAASGLKFSDFGIDERAANFELQWLKGPGRNAVHTGILNLLQNPNCTNEDVMRWVEKNFKKEEVESHQFIRELMSAICKSYFNTKERRLDAEGLKSRVPLLRKYLDDDKERGTQALFGVQHLLCELEHPQGVVRTLFDLFYDEDIISEESFFEWERRDGSPDDMVGKGVVKMNVKDFFEWLRSNGEEEDRTS